MTIATDLLQSLVDAGGALEAGSLQLPLRTAQKALKELRDSGYLILQYQVTDHGRQALADHKRTKRKPPARGRFARGLDAVAAAEAKPAKVELSQYPLAETDDQIEKLKAKAREDRSFGWKTGHEHV